MPKPDAAVLKPKPASAPKPKPVEDTRAPIPRGVQIVELLQMVSAGEIKLPAFQRGFVWTPEKILNLLDSIYHGYPIGMLLFWLTYDSLPEERDLGDLQLPDTPDMQPTNYVLDGQQRLVTLYGSLTRFLESSEFFPVYFDLREKKFKSEGGADWPDRLPMWTVLDVSALVGQVQALLKLPNGDALIEVAQDLAQRFQSYPVPILEIRQNDMDKIAPIFERINSTATRLTLFDFMVAALWTPKFNLKAKVNEIQESLEPKGFDGIVEETVVRAIATVALDTANRETMMTGLRARPRSTLAKEVTATGDALLRAVDFLSSDLYVVEDEILPYDRQLVLLAYIFHHRKHPNAAEIRILKRWFWRTSFSERYRRGGEGLFDEDLSAAREALKDPDVLDRFGDAPKAGSLITSMFRLAAAFTKGYVSLLASSHPKNLKTGQNIDVAKALSPYNRKQFHHIFPKAFLKKMLPDEKRVDSMVNMCMLGAEDNRAIGARAPSDYMGALRKEHGVAEFNRILESNLIPAGAWKFFATDDFDGFLKIRANYLETRLALLIHGTG